VDAFSERRFLKISKRTLFSSWPETSPGSVPMSIRILNTIGDARLVQIVWTHDHFDSIASRDLDEILAQFSGNMRQNTVPVFKFNPEHGARKHGNDLAVYFDFIICHNAFGKPFFWSYRVGIKAKTTTRDGMNCNSNS
jgi:hypothetical protein